MEITVHRWPVKRDTGTGRFRQIERVAAPLDSFTCGSQITKTRAEVHFPGARGVWEFSLKTGMPIVATMRDYVIDEDSLRALREARKAGLAEGRKS